MRDGIDVDLLLAGQRVHGRAVVIDQTRQPDFAEGLAAYLRAIPQARRVLAPPTPGAPSSTNAETRQASDSTVLVRVDLQE